MEELYKIQTLKRLKNFFHDYHDIDIIITIIYRNLYYIIKRIMYDYSVKYHINKRYLKTEKKKIRKVLEKKNDK